MAQEVREAAEHKASSILDNVMKQIAGKPICHHRGPLKGAPTLGNLQVGKLREARDQRDAGKFDILALHLVLGLRVQDCGFGARVLG